MSPHGSTLARRYLEGKREAARVVQSWVRQAASPFRRRLADDWEDAVHESLLETTEALRAGKVRDLARLRAWVFKTTAHTCLDRIRARARWSWVDAESVDLIHRASALKRLLEGAEVDRLLALVDRCPAHCRYLWGMILEGLGYREMSERTGLAEGTLRVRVLRCRRRARALAEREEEGTGDDRPVTKDAVERQTLVDGNDHGL